MSEPRVLIYDCEIIKGILNRNEPPEVNIEYCNGWNDHAGMGISCICAWDSAEDRFRVFLKDNFNEFQSLILKVDILAGFNNVNFDDRLLLANGFMMPKAMNRYDLLREIWRGAGVDPDIAFDFKKHGGFGLDACARSNFGAQKTGDGAKAPIDFQRGKIGAVVDYCLADVWLTKRLYDQIQSIGVVFDPRAAFREIPLKVRSPFVGEAA